MIVVIPFSRPDRVDHVLATINRLQCGERTIVVENARALGAFPRGPWTVARSAPSAGAARNEGLRLARKRGAPLVSFMDDDDYYGPGYLAEAWAVPADVDATHKGIGFVRFNEGLYLFNACAHKYACLVANSLTVRTVAAPDFPEVSGGEEIAWTREFRAHGGRDSTLAPGLFIYDRRGDSHAYQCSKTLFLRTWGAARKLGKRPDTAVDTAIDVGSCPVARVPSDDAVFSDLQRVYLRTRRLKCASA
jgi:hypothetical protein